MKWLPRPSLHTAIGLGAFAMAAMAAGRAGAPRAAAHP
jgi:hypothetical protein